MIIESEFNKKLYRRESVVIFDEILRFPKARQAVKYLVADGRFDYIETGSLISIKENVDSITLPSEERRLAMYPMDFEEFAWALGDEMMVNHCFNYSDPNVGLSLNEDRK